MFCVGIDRSCEMWYNDNVTEGRWRNAQECAIRCVSRDAFMSCGLRRRAFDDDNREHEKYTCDEYDYADCRNDDNHNGDEKADKDEKNNNYGNSNDHDGVPARENKCGHLHQSRYLRGLRCGGNERFGAYV